MSIDYKVNGTSLLGSTVRFHPLPSGVPSTGDLGSDGVQIHERVGGITGRQTYGGKTFTVRGTVVGKTSSERLSYCDALTALLAQPALTWSWTNDANTTRELANCYLQGRVNIDPPRQDSVAAGVSFTLRTEDPRWQASTDTTVTLASAGVDYSCALGSAPGDGVITITGATNPTVTIKNGSAAAVITLVFNITTGSDDLVIDLTRRVIEFDDGSPASAISALTSGYWPFQMLPSWYNGVTAPTIRTSSGTGTFVYRKRYW